MHLQVCYTYLSVPALGPLTLLRLVTLPIVSRPTRITYSHLSLGSRSI